MRVVPILLLTALASTPAFAQAASVPGTADGPRQDLAGQTATAAVAACERLGFRIMATVVDANGRLLAARAAGPDVISALATDSVHSAEDAAYFHERSSAIPQRIMEEASVFYALHDHPELAPLVPGGWPLPMGGGIGVAGAPDGQTDEECASAAVGQVAPRPK